MDKSTIEKKQVIENILKDLDWEYSHFIVVDSDEEWAKVTIYRDVIEEVLQKHLLSEIPDAN